MQQERITVLGGGLDLITAHVQKSPGALIGAVNYESVNDGYRRFQGYERFDGRVAPSATPYYALSITDVDGDFDPDDVITGSVSGAQATVLRSIETNEDSPYANDDEVFANDLDAYANQSSDGTVYLFGLSGSFVDGDVLTVQSSGAEVAVASGPQVEFGAVNADTDMALRSEAANAQRDQIGMVPGEGPVLGVHRYRGTTYAWRKFDFEDSVGMYQSTPAGWDRVFFGQTLSFVAGSTEFVEGGTILGATSGASATVRRTVVRSGIWGNSDAVGYLVLSGVTGTFVDGEALSGTGVASVDGTQEDIKIPSGGKIDCVNHNFFGASNFYRVYGVSRAGFAFEFDGQILSPIRTGIADLIDRPRRIAVHNNHLLLGYDGGAVLHSGTGLPLSFLAIDGAGEFSLGEDLTSIVANSSTATVVFGKNRIGYLTGSSANNFSFETITDMSGAKSDTAVMLSSLVFMDDQGLRDLATSQAFGDWRKGTITRQVSPLIEQKQRESIVPVGAHKVRSKDQYRVYFSDGTGLAVYFGRNNPEAIPFKLGFIPFCVTSGETETGAEVIFAGGENGYVYQIDSGTSQDGEALSAYLRLAFDHLGAPHKNKRFHTALADVKTENSKSRIGVLAEYNYGDPDFQSGAEKLLEVAGSGGFWDEALYDQFVWQAPIQGRLQVDLQGIGENVSYLFLSDEANENPHTISSITTYYTGRRGNR